MEFFKEKTIITGLAFKYVWVGIINSVTPLPLGAKLKLSWENSLKSPSELIDLVYSMQKYFSNHFGWAAECCFRQASNFHVGWKISCCYLLPNSEIFSFRLEFPFVCWQEVFWKVIEWQSYFYIYRIKSCLLIIIFQTSDESHVVGPNCVISCARPMKIIKIIFRPVVYNRMD